MKISIVVILLFCFLEDFCQKKQWIKNTFAGQGHMENPGPWKKKQGTERAEWVSAFGVSPIIPPGDEAPLMLQVTDLATLQYSSDGKEFKRANMPLTRGGAVAFNPHDGNVGYALMEPDPELDLGGWWRTEDKGKTWQFMVKSPSVRGQRNNLFEVSPKPEFRNHIYIAAGTPSDSRVANFPNFIAGLYRSIDNGNTWSLIDFSGEEIYQIRFNSDGSQLYVLAYAGGTLNDEGGVLYRLSFDATGTNYTKTFVRENIRNMDVDPQIAHRGMFLDKSGYLYEFANFGASINLLYDMKGYRFVKINPSNNQHIILFSAGLMQDDPFIWSNNGGAAWNMIEEEGDYFPTWYDYSPINRSSDNYWYKKAEGTATIVDGNKDVFAFWPGNLMRVLNWATNIRKGPLMSLDYGRTFKPFAHGGSFKGTEGGNLGSAMGVIGLAKNEYGFVLTKDNGITWKGCSVLSSPVLLDIYLNHPNPRNYKRRNGNSLDFNPNIDNIIIGSFGITPTYIVRSENFGETWTTIDQFNPTDFDNPDKENLRATKVFWHNQNPDIVYVGPMKSIDGGKTFSPISERHFVSDIHEKNGDVVLSVEVPAEIYLSYDAGETWGRISNAPGAKTGSFVAVTAASARSYAFDLRDKHDPAKGGRVRILAGGEFGIYEFLADASDSYTGQWRLISNGFDISADPYLKAGSPYYYSHVAVDQREGYHNQMYVLTGATRGRRSYYRQAYHSTDYGESWSPIMHDTIPGSPHYVSAQWSDVDWNGNFIYNDWDGMFIYTDIMKVEVEVNLPNSGIILGDTSFTYRQQVELTAVAESGYEFVAWQDGDNVISTNPALTFIGYQDKKLKAIFKKLNTYVLNRETDERIIFYPNPATKEINILQKTMQYNQFEITTLLGHSLKKGDLKKETTIKINDLPNGLYLLKIGECFAFKMIVQH